MHRKLLISLCSTLLAIASYGQDNLLPKARVKVSSTADGYRMECLNDGMLGRSSMWMTDPGHTAPHTADFTFPFYASIDSIIIHTGFPDNEMRPSERQQAAGFWCMNNFCLEYWDDANWTELPQTNVTENRLNKVVFIFDKPFTSFRIRLKAFDGNPVRVREVMAFGQVDSSIAPPVFEELEETQSQPSQTSVLKAEVTDKIIGKSLEWVAYNQGYFVPGGNAVAWMEYSGVNAVRLWASLNTYVKKEWLSDDFGAVDSQEDFNAARKKFLADPQKYMPLDSIRVWGEKVVPSTNTMSFGYALRSLKALGVDVLVQSSIERAYYDAGWQHRWELWERIYTLAYYANELGGMKMLAMCNEPNHRNAGPMPMEAWISLAKTAADALHCAVPESSFVGPVTAGTNANWWSEVAREDVVDIFSTHSYNLPANGYYGRVSKVNEIYRENHPRGETRPVIFTETGRWMNAYLIDKEETMDSPSLFTEWAGMYVRNMMEGCSGMWAFKFATTLSGTYPWGIKSGHHYIWRGKRFLEDSFENIAEGASVTSSDGSVSAVNVTDADKSTSWDCSSETPKWVRLDFGGLREIGGLVVYSGSEGGTFTAPNRVRDMDIEYLDESGQWKKIKKPDEAYFKYAQLYYTIDPAVKASGLRVTVNDEGDTRIREIKVFPAGTLANAEECYDVSGVQRTAEVVRLFAKGFKQSRPLNEVVLSSQSRDMDICASENPEDGSRYVWIIRRERGECALDLDMSRVGIKAGTPVVAETVSADSYGEASVMNVGTDGCLHLVVPAQSVTLLTITPSDGIINDFPAKDLFSVNLASRKVERHCPRIEMNAGERSSNDVAFASFDLSGTELGSSGRIVLSLNGISNAAGHQRLHVYCHNGLAKPRPWARNPYLDSSQSRAIGLGENLFVAGEITFTPQMGCHSLDITDVVKKHSSGKVSFMIIREAREYGDDYDNGIHSEIKGAKIQIWNTENSNKANQ